MIFLCIIIYAIYSLPIVPKILYRDTSILGAGDRGGVTPKELS